MLDHFGCLTILEKAARVSDDKELLYWCRCACGNISIFSNTELVLGHTLDCGCRSYRNYPCPENPTMAK
jgi:hypothetical protein